jgi:1A family penicillin-binding protein
MPSPSAAAPRPKGGRPAVKQQRRRPKPYRPPALLRRFFGALGILFGVLLSFVLIGAAGAAGYLAYLVRETASDLPHQNALLEYTPGGVTTIYATDKDPKTGKLIVLGKIFRENKEYAPISEIPAVMKNATISIEDERFYQHRGVDLEGVARALYKNIRARDMSEGASTLTQQLARTIYNDRKKTLKRKLQEALYALLLEKNFSKEQILEMYLNEVNYGNNTYGVKAAAKMYFGRTPKQLSLSQAALLAGIPQRPTDLELFQPKHRKLALERRNVVLAKMAELGYIKPEQAKVAQKNGVRLISDKPQVHVVYKAPYFTTYVRQLLLRKYGEETVYTGGLQVYTTLNYQMQQEAEKALRAGVAEGRGDGVTEGALVSLEPRTGYIRAMVGGVDFEKSEYNHAAQGGRQPGSSFKAIDYAAAMAVRPDRYSADGSVDNSRLSYPDGRGRSYSPAGHGPSGWVSLRSAVGWSYNNAAVNTVAKIGPRRVVEYARKMGVRSPLEPNLSIALGSYPVSPLEMANVYSVFPNHGNRAEPMAIIRVVDAEGVTLESNPPRVDVAVLPEFAVSNVSELLVEPIRNGTAMNADGIHEVADAHGKTGTTNDNRDAWFVGYTPELSTAVWVGSVQRKTDKKGRVSVRYAPMPSYATGGHVCAPVWARFMKAAVPIQRQSKMPVLPSPEQTDPGKNIMVRMSPQRRPETDPEETYAAELERQRDRGEKAPRVTDAPKTSAAEAATPAAAPTTGTPSLAADTGTTAPDGPTLAVQPASAAAVPPPVTRTAVAAAAPPVEAPRPRPVQPAVEETVTISVCADSGQRATAYCPETVARTFARGRAPRRSCRIHRGE